MSPSTKTAESPRHARPGWILVLTVALSAGACAAQQKVVETPFYKLQHPEYWKVEAVAKAEGEPTKVVIGKYSETVIKEGVGGVDDMASALYESSQADVQVRVYAWTAPQETGDPPNMVVQRLADEPELELREHGLIPRQPPECGREFELKYRIGGSDASALDLLKQPGWRTILLGGIRNGMLLGVVARVPYEQDSGLYCHNLGLMRVELQNFLDALTLAPSPPAGGAGEPAAPATEGAAPEEAAGAADASEPAEAEPATAPAGG